MNKVNKVNRCMAEAREMLRGEANGTRQVREIFARACTAGVEDGSRFTRRVAAERRVQRRVHSLSRVRLRGNEGRHSRQHVGKGAVGAALGLASEDDALLRGHGDAYYTRATGRSQQRTNWTRRLLRYVRREVEAQVEAVSGVSILDSCAGHLRGSCTSHRFRLHTIARCVLDKDRDECSQP